MEETKLFLITYFAALFGVVTPGLVNMSVAKTCLKRGKKDGVLVAIGACVVVVLQALIAVLLIRYIFNNPFIHNILLRTGLVIFVLMGVYFLVMAQRKRKEVEISDTSGTTSVLKGMAISALNIFPIPYFGALAVALNVGGNENHDGFQILIFVVAAALGTFTTLYFYVFFFLKIEDKAVYFNKYSNYFMAILMLVLVIITLFRIFYG